MGARGETEAQMLHGLKLSGARESIASEFHQLLQGFENNTMLKLANKVYTMEGYDLKPSFQEIAKKDFYSEGQSVNFADNVQSANAINHWVEDHTNNRIKDLIQADSLSADTRMVLVNAIYFKGLWEHQFEKHATIKQQFFTSETDSVDVDMMHVKNKFRYTESEELDAQLIDLPYKDSDISMLIILPKSRTGLSALESKLKSSDLSTLTKSMYQTEVTVSLPKFKVEFEIKLNTVLQKVKTFYTNIYSL